MPNISVIIPVYNTGKYLERCIQSLIKQTLNNIEIIFINDCSTDNSLKILQEYESIDSRIKIYNLEKNSGAAIARNMGLINANGEYISFIDSDDSIDLNFYEKLYKKAIETNAEIVKCKRRTYETNGQITYSNLNEAIKEKGDLFFGYEWTTAIYKSSLIKENNIKFPPELIKAQDITFLNKILLKTTKPIEFVDDVYYNYYRRSGSLNAKNISLEYVKSAVLAQKIQCKDFNNSTLFEKNPNLYIELYVARPANLISNTIFQNDSYEARFMCATGIIDCYRHCKDKVAFQNKFPYKQLIPYIKDYKTKKIAKILYKIKNKSEISEYNTSFLQKIFSIRKTSDRKHKILRLLGIKFKFKIIKDYPVSLSRKEIQLLIKYMINTKNKKYLEFGSGGSTFISLLKSDLENIVSVESDAKWIDYLRKWDIIKDNEKNKRLSFKYINIGKVGKWGKPIDDSGKEMYPNYSKQVYDEKIFDNKYDIVFIDGRFRVACALQTIINCSDTTKIIIHDFCCREEYHILLKYLDIVELIDTICVFRIKKNLNLSEIKMNYETYKYDFR